MIKFFLVCNNYDSCYCSSLFNIKAYFGDLDFLELVVFFASFSSVYSPIFKGLFLQLQSMSPSFHAQFILIVLPLFFIFLGRDDRNVGDIFHFLLAFSDFF